jgi:hypothetical protein
MTAKPQKETPTRVHDWATAATEARRQRDADAKAELIKRKWQRRQEHEAANAWAPTHEIPRIRRG